MLAKDKSAVGLTGYLAGAAAEDCVARHYEAAGMRIAHQRWRGAGGEIDLVVRNGGEVIFVEVKKSRDFDRAADRLGARQIRRLLAAGEEFVGGEPAGALTEMRFDVALVNGQGQVRIVENALQAV